jgi:hypothetical protein
LTALAGLNSLKELDLTGTKATHAGVTTLLKAPP